MLLQRQHCAFGPRKSRSRSKSAISGFASGHGLEPGLIDSGMDLDLDFDDNAVETQLDGAVETRQHDGTLETQLDKQERQPAQRREACSDDAVTAA